MNEGQLDDYTYMLIFHFILLKKEIQLGEYSYLKMKQLPPFPFETSHHEENHLLFAFSRPSKYL